MRRAQPHLGTLVEITIDGDPGAQPDRETEAAIDAAFAAVARVHRLMTFHDAASDIGRLNRAAPGAAVRVDPWTWEVLATALALSEDSDGAFDIAVGATLQRMGRLPADDGATHPHPRSRFSGPPLDLLADHTIRVRRAGVRIDLGGIAKGFAVDRAVDALIAHGIASGLVNAGGDLRVFGAAPRRVHIRDPRRPGAFLCAVEVADRALASSAAAGGCHDAAGTVVDPWRQAPATTVRGASVCAASCMIADALTKVVMVDGEIAAAPLGRHRASAMFLSATGELCRTPSWPTAATTPG